MDANVDPRTTLPADAARATLIGRVWLPGPTGGPTPVLLSKGELLDLSIDFGRADADPAGIQHGIRAPVDDEAVVRGALDVVAVMPHARIVLEVGGAVTPVVRVVPEADRHRREWPRAHQLPFLSAYRPAGFVKDLDSHPHLGTLDLTTPDRSRRDATHETADDVGPARQNASAIALVVEQRSRVGERFRSGVGKVFHSVMFPKPADERSESAELIPEIRCAHLGACPNPSV